MSTVNDKTHEAPSSTDVLVAKSNDLVNAVHRLTLVETQLLYFCIAWAREHQTGFDANKPLRLHVSDFAECFGIGHDNAYRQAKDALEGLYKRDLTIYETDPKTRLKEVIRTRWLSRYSYIDGAGVISVIFSIDVIGHISRLEQRFTTYKLLEICKFTSTYAIRLFDLLMQFKDKGWRTISIEDLRETFGLGATQYKVIYEFKRRTVDVAVAQINEMTNWNVSYKQEKFGAKIIGLTFKIKPKPQSKPKEKTSEKKVASQVDDAYVTRHARPGESWPEARTRLQIDWKNGINHDQNPLL